MKVLFAILILFSVHAAKAEEFMCREFFHFDKDLIADLDFTFQTQENIDRILKTTDATTYGFKVNDDIIKIGDIVYFGLNKETQDMPFLEVQGTVVGARIMYDQKVKRSDVFLVVFDLEMLTTYFISHRMIDLEDAEIMARKYNETIH